MKNPLLRKKASASDEEVIEQMARGVREALDDDLAIRDAAIRAVDEKADKALAGVKELKARPLLPPSALAAFRRGLGK